MFTQNITVCYKLCKDAVETLWIVETRQTLTFQCVVWSHMSLKEQIQFIETR